MFTNQTVLKHLIKNHMQRAAEDIAALIGLLDDSSVEKVGAAMQEGFRLQLAVTTPAQAGDPTVLCLALVNPSTGQTTAIHTATTGHTATTEQRRRAH